MKTIKVLKVVTVEHEIPLLDFINSRSTYFEHIEKETDTCYIPDPSYPNESFILICQEVDSGEISYHEMGYVLCPSDPNLVDLKQYVLDHIQEFVLLDV